MVGHTTSAPPKNKKHQIEENAAVTINRPPLRGFHRIPIPSFHRVLLQEYRRLPKNSKRSKKSGFLPCTALNSLGGSWGVDTKLFVPAINQLRDRSEPN
jgi:hypothetical protein